MTVVIPAYSSGAGNFVNENRYPAQIMTVAVIPAPARGRANRAILCIPGRCPARNMKISETATQAGKNAKKENFESEANPAQSPSSSVLAGVGPSTHLASASQ